MKPLSLRDELRQFNLFQTKAKEFARSLENVTRLNDDSARQTALTSVIIDLDALARVAKRLRLLVHRQTANAQICQWQGQVYLWSKQKYDPEPVTDYGANVVFEWPLEMVRDYLDCGGSYDFALELMREAMPRHLQHVIKHDAYKRGRNGVLSDAILLLTTELARDQFSVEEYEDVLKNGVQPGATITVFSDEFEDSDQYFDALHKNILRGVHYLFVTNNKQRLHSLKDRLEYVQVAGEAQSKIWYSTAPEYVLAVAGHKAIVLSENTAFGTAKRKYEPSNKDGPNIKDGSSNKAFVQLPDDEVNRIADSVIRPIMDSVRSGAVHFASEPIVGRELCLNWSAGNVN